MQLLIDSYFINHSCTKKSNTLLTSGFICCWYLLRVSELKVIIFSHLDPGSRSDYSQEGHGAERLECQVGILGLYIRALLN